MRKNIFLTAAAVTLAMVSASAQNLNPTVEVTNDFLGKTVEASKPVGRMEVPDSVMKFDLDFDYSVLSSPYKGGYDFSPYLLEMRPAADAYKAGKFYLRAGAGYTLNPEFDLVWSPKLKNQSLHLNVFARNRSYVGDYRAIMPKENVDENGYADGTFGFVPADDEDGKALTAKGYDLHSVAGFNGKYDMARASMDFALSYEGIHDKGINADATVGQDYFSGFELPVKGNYNAVEGKAGIHSNDDGLSSFKYDADLMYRYSISDEYSYKDWWRSIKSNDIALTSELGPVIDETHSVLVGVGMLISTYTAPTSYLRLYPYEGLDDEFMHSQAGHLYVAPHYVLSSYRMKLQAGLKLDMAIASKNEFIGSLPINQNKGQLIYPDVRFDYQLIREHLDVYAAVTGGVDHNSYTSLKQEDHFYRAVNSSSLWNPVSMNTVERFNAKLGFRGNVASVFRYDLSGGYASYGGYRHSVVGYEFMRFGTLGRPSLVSGGGPFFGYDDAHVAYADFRFALDLGSVLFDGGLTYTHTDLLKNEKAGFSPSPLVGNVSFRYDWKNRISAGIHADGALRRNGLWGSNVDYIESIESIRQYEVFIPGFVNLGIDASFAFNRKLSVWLKGDNLLCQAIQRTPLYAEKGIKFTAGICLNL